MFVSSLPPGFGFTWDGDTVRIKLPPFDVVDGRAYEPVLSRRDVERVADAIDAHAEKRRRAGASESIAHVRLSRDARYSRGALTKFRTQLSVSLVELGHDIQIDEKTTMSGTGQLAGAGI